MQRPFKLIKGFGLGVVPLLKLRESLLKDARLTQSYIVLLVGSCLIATSGLLINSAAVIIGAMIIAPLIMPLRGLPFAMLEGDRELLSTSFLSVLVGTILSILVSGLVGLIISLPDFGTEILSRTQPTLIDLLIAIAAGGISGYAKIRPEIGDAISGTAIAVALMPPLCVIGLGIAQGSREIALGASLLYVTNLIGISLACIMIYVLGGYARSSELARTLSWGVTLALIAMLAMPLGISFWQLTNYSRVGDSVEELLVSQSLVDRPDIQIENIEIDWRKKPPVALISVRATQTISPKEVALVEQNLLNELKIPFKIIFDVSPTNLVESE